MALVCLLCKMRSGLKVSPLIKLGDNNNSRIAYQHSSDAVILRVLFGKRRTIMPCINKRTEHT